MNVIKTTSIIWRSSFLRNMQGIAGVDEAGRGCVIGPLIVAGIMFKKDDLGKLVDLGVKDSKLLRPKKRLDLEESIKELALDYSFFDLQPKSIDKVVNRSKPLRKLNYLTGVAMARVIRDIEPSDVYIDPADVNITRFIDQITRIIPFKTKIVCEPKADRKYQVVSAASILAKVRRDRYIEELREKYGDFNSGYCSDVKTISWLKNWIMEHDDFPFFVRKSWKTIKKLLNG